MLDKESLLKINIWHNLALKVSKKRAEEITRRRNTIIQTASDLDISHINHLEVVAEDALLNLNNEEVLGYLYITLKTTERLLRMRS